MRIKTLVAAAAAAEQSGELRRRGAAEPKALGLGPGRGRCRCRCRRPGSWGGHCEQPRSAPGSASGFGSTTGRNRCSREMWGYRRARALFGDIFPLFLVFFVCFSHPRLCLGCVPRARGHARGKAAPRPGAAGYHGRCSPSARPGCANGLCLQWGRSLPIVPPRPLPDASICKDTLPLEKTPQRPEKLAVKGHFYLLSLSLVAR